MRELNEIGLAKRYYGGRELVNLQHSISISVRETNIKLFFIYDFSIHFCCLLREWNACARQRSASDES